ncbi:hypothetical protein ACUXJ9_000393 [Staphylococcus caledonicus]
MEDERNKLREENDRSSFELPSIVKKEMTDSYDR